MFCFISAFRSLIYCCIDVDFLTVGTPTRTPTQTSPQQSPQQYPYDYMRQQQQQQQQVLPYSFYLPYTTPNEYEPSVNLFVTPPRFSAVNSPYASSASSSSSSSYSSSSSSSSTSLVFNMTPYQQYYAPSSPPQVNRALTYSSPTATSSSAPSVPRMVSSPVTPASHNDIMASKVAMFSLAFLHIKFS
jgi:hypothetical protein